MANQNLSVLFLLVFAVFNRGAFSYRQSDDASTVASDSHGHWTSHYSVKDALLGVFKTTSNKDDSVSTFTLVGGDVSMTRPCCVSWGYGRIDCFLHGPSSSVLHFWKEGGAYAWEDLGHEIIGNIECLSTKPGTIDLIVTGKRHWTYTAAYDNGKWTSWRRKLQLIVMETPSCATRMASSYDCMKRGTDNSAFYVGGNNDRWVFQSKNLRLHYPIVVVSLSATAFSAFGCHNDNYIYEIHYNSGWTDWKKLGVNVWGRPTAVSWDANRIDVFVLSNKNELMHRARENGSWKAWENLKGKLEEVPSCVTIGQSIHCFAVGPSSFLYRISYVDGKWTDWIVAYGAFLDAPACVVSNENEVTCYARGFTKHIVEAVYKF